MILSATIRWTPAGTWEPISDDTHQPVGIARVETLADRVRVHYDFTAELIHSVQATPDEAFAAADVRCGASVGLSFLDVLFYMPSWGSLPVPPSLLSRPGANVWLSGHFS